MTKDELLKLLDQQTLADETTLMRAIITHQQRRLSAHRRKLYAEQDEAQHGCDHVWEHWQGGRGEHFKRCVKCGMTPEPTYSDD